MCVCRRAGWRSYHLCSNALPSAVDVGSRPSTSNLHPSPPGCSSPFTGFLSFLTRNKIKKKKQQQPSFLAILPVHADQPASDDVDRPPSSRGPPINPSSALGARSRKLFLLTINLECSHNSVLRRLLLVVLVSFNLIPSNYTALLPRPFSISRTCVCVCGWSKRCLAVLAGHILFCCLLACLRD